MAQDYEIIDFKAGDFKDHQGNVWVEVAFKGVSEPARWAMRPESVEKYTVGTEVYGHIEDATSKAGKPYNRFKTDKREDYNQAPAAPQTSASHATQQAKSTDDYWSDKDKAIRAQWAIGQAKDWALGNDMDFDEIEVVANEFFGMVQRVKGGLSVTDVKKAIPDVVVEPEDGPITYEDIPDFA